MTKRIGGARKKTRQKMKKSLHERRKIKLRNFLQEFKVGDKVVLKAEPAYQKGIYFRAFHGKTGTIAKQRGFCYEVTIKDGKKEKTTIVHPVHLRKK
ncbi:MAG: 50S ribosomal protein L21e [archaeon]